MSIKQENLLENIRDVIKDDSKKQDALKNDIKEGVMTQKQLADLAKAERTVRGNLTKATNRIATITDKNAKDRSVDEKKALKKSTENSKKEKARLDDIYHSLAAQEDQERDASKVRGMSLDKFKELKGKTEDSDEKLAAMQEQAKVNEGAGVKDYKLQKQIQNEEKRKERLQRKLEGGKLTRAKAQIKAALYQATTLEGIRGGIAGLGKGMLGGLGKMGGKGMKGMGGMLGLIMKGAMLALLPALLLFFNSPLWTKTKKFLIETALPAVTKFYHDAIVPAFTFIKEKILPVLMKFFGFLKDKILPIVVDTFGKLFEKIGTLFSDLGGAFQKFADGDIIGGIIDLIIGIPKFLFGLIDIGITNLFNILGAIFGFEGTDSIFGSIAGFFTGIYDSVVSTISGLFTGITTFISEKFTAIIDYIKNIFGFDEGGFSFANLVDLAFMGLNLAINFIKDIFGFGNPDKPFKMSEFLAGIFTKIGDFFRSLFDIDIRALASKFLPKKAVDFLLGKDETEAKNLEAAEESGFYTKRGIGRDSRIDQGLIKFAPEGQLQAILADNDLANEDKIMVERELSKRKLQKDLQKGNLGEPAQVDEYGGTAGAITRAAVEKDVMRNSVGGGGTLITTNNVSTTKNVTSQTNVSPVVDADPALKAMENSMF